MLGSVDRTLRIVIIAGIVIASLSVVYYLFIFQPQLAVNSCLERAKKDFETSKANECKNLYETGQNLYKNCLNRGLTPGICTTLTFDSVPAIWPESPSSGCNIPENRMSPLQKDYSDAIEQCRSLSLIRLQ